MHVEVLLQLLRAHEAAVALVTRPVLLLLPQHYETTESEEQQGKARLQISAGVMTVRLHGHIDIM